jgi:hypothetical protein
MGGEGSDSLVHIWQAKSLLLINRRATFDCIPTGVRSHNVESGDGGSRDIG